MDNKQYTQVTDEPNDPVLPISSNTTNFPNVYADNIVYAINFGGDTYTATNGVSFQADDYLHDQAQDSTDKIYGSQDDTLYKTYI